MGAFLSPESKSEQRFYDNRNTASGNAVINNPRQSGGVAGDKVTVKVGSGATYEVNNITQAGYTQEQLDAMLEEKNRSLALAVAGINASGGDDDITPVVQERANDQIKNAPAKTKKEQFSIGLIAFAMLLIAGGALFFGLRKGKKA